MEENKNAKKQIPLRISAQLYDELSRWADDEYRSINGQIEYLLHECVKTRRKKTYPTNKESARHLAVRFPLKMFVICKFLCYNGI